MTNDIQLEHLGGVPWWEARIPWWWHKCKPQTIGWMPGDYVERCACGAISGRGARGMWIQRNSRRREAMRQKEREWRAPWVEEERNRRRAERRP